MLGCVLGVGSVWCCEVCGGRVQVCVGYVGVLESACCVLWKQPCDWLGRQQRVCELCFQGGSSGVDGASCRLVSQGGGFW